MAGAKGPKCKRKNQGRKCKNHKISSLIWRDSNSQTPSTRQRTGQIQGRKNTKTGQTQEAIKQGTRQFAHRGNKDGGAGFKYRRQRDTRGTITVAGGHEQTGSKTPTASRNENH